PKALENVLSGAPCFVRKISERPRVEIVHNRGSDSTGLGATSTNLDARSILHCGLIGCHEGWGPRQAAPPAHAAPCLRVQARQRWPRYAGVAALPRAQEHPAHGQIHRNGARPVQEFLALTGDGKLGMTSASPSIVILRWIIRLSIASRVRSSCSSVIALTPPE